MTHAPLTELLPDRGPVYSVIRNRSRRSGSVNIDVYAIRNNVPINVTRAVAAACKLRTNSAGCIVVHESDEAVATALGRALDRILLNEYI